MKYEPQLATLVKSPAPGDGWLHEIKFDGYRIGCRITTTGVTLTTRNGQDYTAAFPEVVAAARALDTDDALIDGEVTAVLPDGRTSFQALQGALSGSGPRTSLVYFVFDLLHLDGKPLLSVPLDTRKEWLRALVGTRAHGRIRYVDHIVGHGPAFFEEAARLGLEGIVSKRRDAVYEPGRRSGWTKSKCVRRQPFVIGGFTDQKGMTGGLGALLVGCYEGRRLVYAGNVGTGFTQKVAADLRRRLEAIARDDSPFDPPPAGAVGKTAHFVQPQLVCDVTFTEWTGDDKIRHPSFQGLIAEKHPRRVVRARP